jgi:hypothetical protein
MYQKKAIFIIVAGRTSDVDCLLKPSNINFTSIILLVGKPEGRRPLGTPRRRWLDNIRMDIVEVGWSDVDWIGPSQDRDRWRALVDSVLNLRVP